MSFYVTLPSNASMSLYPLNTPGNYFVKLPQTIELNTNYEVALVEAQIPNRYINVKEGEMWFYFIEESSRPILCYLPQGLYKSPEHFIDELNQLIIERIEKKKNDDLNEEEGVIDDSVTFRFYFNELTKKAVVTLYKTRIEVKLSKQLMNILGLSHGILKNEFETVVGDREVDIDGELTNVFVYCDIVATRIVGDVMAPLLRTIPIIDSQPNYMIRIYEKPHYVPLSRFSFDTIELVLNTDRGKTISFTTGPSVVTLHFRTKKHIDFE